MKGKLSRQHITEQSNEEEGMMNLCIKKREKLVPSTMEIQ